MIHKTIFWGTNPVAACLISLILIVNITRGQESRSWRKDTTNTPKFEFVNYTDFKGFDQDQPNGVAQSQFLFKWPMFSRLYNPFKPKGQDGTRHRDTGYGFVFFRDFIFPNFLFNRIDKSNDFLPYQPVYDTLKRPGMPDSINISKIIHSFDIANYSTFVLNGKLIFLTVHFPRSRINVEWNFSLYKIKVQDTINTVKSFLPVYAIGNGFDLYYDTKYSDKEFPFNLRVLVGYQKISLKDNFYVQADGASISPDGKKKIAFPLNDFKRLSAPIWHLSVTLKKSLGFKKDSEPGENDHYLFFRYAYSYQKFTGLTAIPNRPGELEKRNFTNNFSQFQLGIDLNFGVFFKSDKPAETAAASADSQQ